MTLISPPTQSSLTNLNPRAHRPADEETLVAFRMENHVDGIAFPITCGIPLPPDTVSTADDLHLREATGKPVVAQFEPLAHWPNGSLKAVRADWLGTHHQYELCLQRTPASAPPATRSTEPRADNSLCRFDEQQLQITHPTHGELTLRLHFADERGSSLPLKWAPPQTLLNGPVRTVLELHAQVPAITGLHIRLRLSIDKQSPYINASVRLHNARRARHKGGLWDLGDSNAIHFQSFDLIAERPGPHRVNAQYERAGDWDGPLEQIRIYQDSSGGKNWNSVNHVDRHGDVPCRFRGYLATEGDQQIHKGLRATPTLILDGAHPLTVTLPEFWQQFPKAISAQPDVITIALFPSDWAVPHELQPGERKTHEIWLALSNDPRSLQPAHAPPIPIFPPEWYAQCDLFDAWPGPRDSYLPIYQELLRTTLDGQQGLAARREVIDEYGWRNWGELWADHEQPPGVNAPPVVSHYNNQYDAIEGTLRHFALTGDLQWRQLSDPIARHVLDIDLYHTDHDRPVYNYGYFWHTDHYRPAQTATHRTYSRTNQDGRSHYGGGPSSSHCYSTGFLHLYYLTGEPDYRETVINLAEWLIAMEDGTRTEFCLLDRGATGISTISAESWYHGPGRAPANTISTLVDAWELTNNGRYRDHAEQLLERVVTPGEDLNRLELLDIERRWFYTMFLQSLAKYLAAKIRVNENDAAYARAVAVAQDYAAWMLENEQPYFDREEELEFPTETWAAQEIRKANAMRSLARFCPPILATKVRARALEIADRGWRDLSRFESRTFLRPTVILLIEGLRDAFHRTEGDSAPPVPIVPVERQAERPPFVTQRERAKYVLRSPAKLMQSVGNSVHPARLKHFLNAVRARF